MRLHFIQLKSCVICILSQLCPCYLQASERFVGKLMPNSMFCCDIQHVLVHIFGTIGRQGDLFR